MRSVLWLIAAGVILGGCRDVTAPPTVASLTITPATATILENGGAPLQAIILDSTGAVIRGVEVTWFSNDYTIASAFPSPSETDGPEMGYVHGTKPGTVTVSARVGEKVASATITVERAAAARIDVGPLNVTLLSGQTQQMSASVKDANGYTLNGRTITWTSSNSVATVSATGLVTAVSPGQGFITAQSEGASTTREITVLPSVLSYEYYKRGGPLTPGEATLTFANSVLSGVLSGTLRIDGLTLPVLTSYSSAGVYCIVSQLVNGVPGVLTACGYKPNPMTLFMCTSPSGLEGPRVLQYVMFPSNDPNRVPSNEDALLAAMPGASVNDGMDVFNTCPVNVLPPKWVRAGTSADFWLYPNTTTVYTPAQVRAMLTGALIQATPAAGTDFRKYVVLRMGNGSFELWH